MNKTLNVFVVDRNGTPIPSARVIVSNSGQRIVTGTTTGKRNRPVSLQLDEAYGSVDITVEFDRWVKGPVTVDLATRNYEVGFQEVTLPRPNTGPANWEKVVAFIFVYIWIRGTLPRFRYDQLMSFGWKFLFPLALANVVVTSFVVAWFAK